MLLESHLYVVLISYVITCMAGGREGGARRSMVVMRKRGDEALTRLSEPDSAAATRNLGSKRNNSRGNS